MSKEKDYQPAVEMKMVEHNDDEKVIDDDDEEENFRGQTSVTKSAL